MKKHLQTASWIVSIASLMALSVALMLLSACGAAPRVGAAPTPDATTTDDGGSSLVHDDGAVVGDAQAICACQPVPKGDKGEQGVAGPQGEPGTPGMEGRAGYDGEPGLPGTVGSQGPAGATGQPGQPGPQGPQGISGQQGTPGKDGGFDRSKIYKVTNSGGGGGTIFQLSAQCTSGDVAIGGGCATGSYTQDTTVRLISSSPDALPEDTSTQAWGCVWSKVQANGFLFSAYVLCLKQ